LAEFRDVEAGEPFEALLLDVLRVEARLLRTGSFSKADLWSLVAQRLVDQTAEPPRERSGSARRGQGPREVRKRRIEWAREPVAAGTTAGTPRLMSMSHACLDAMRDTGFKATAEHWERVIRASADLVMASCPDGSAPDSALLGLACDGLAALLARLGDDVSDGRARACGAAELVPAVMALSIAGDGRARSAFLLATRLEALSSVRAVEAARPSRRERAEEGISASSLKHVAIRVPERVWGALCKGMAARGDVEGVRETLGRMMAGASVSLEALGGGVHGEVEDNVGVTVDRTRPTSTAYGALVRACVQARLWDQAESVAAGAMRDLQLARSERGAVLGGRVERAGGAAPWAGDDEGAALASSFLRSARPAAVDAVCGELLNGMVVGGARRRARSVFESLVEAAAAVEGGPTGPAPLTRWMWQLRLRAASGAADAESVLGRMCTGDSGRATPHQLWPGAWAGLLDCHQRSRCRLGAASVLGRMQEGVVAVSEAEAAEGGAEVHEDGDVRWALTAGVLAPIGEVAARTVALVPGIAFERRAQTAARAFEGTAAAAGARRGPGGKRPGKGAGGKSRGRRPR